jgi:hypothetical protein
VTWSGRIIEVCLFSVTLICILGCAQTEPVQKLAPPFVVERKPPQQTIEPNQRREPPPAEPNLLEGSGVTAWAKEYVGQLIEGLDGNLYEPYARTTIESVQKALGTRGLYAGPQNGILDRSTMKSIFAYQKANFTLQRCGVPTPHTRKMLEQGSHTDLSY